MSAKPLMLLRHREEAKIGQLKNYRELGGFKAFERAVSQMQPDEVTDIVKASGLRGRGGAGFPTGLKWSFMDKGAWPHYVAVNADESEPGTFKDREIMEKNPYQFLEGVMLCAYAVSANVAYIYLRGEFWELAAELDKHIAKLHKKKIAGRELVRQRLFTDHPHPPGGRCLHLRRRNRDARIAGRQTGPAAFAPALPAQRGPLRQTHCGQQCRNADQRAPDY